MVQQCDTFAAPGAGQPAVMPPADKMGLFRQHSGCMRQSFGQGRGAAAAGGTDSTAFYQLQAVCKARVELYRSAVYAALAALLTFPDCHKAGDRWGQVLWHVLLAVSFVCRA